MNQNKKHISVLKNKKKILLRIGLIILLVVTFLFTASGIFLYLKRDEIAGKILSQINNKSQGELVFKDIRLDALIHFPDISLTLLNVEVFEYKKTVDPQKQAIATIEKVYCGFDVVELIKRNIQVSKITLENGNLLLIHKTDSSFNFINAFKRKSKTELNQAQNIRKKEESDTTVSGIQFSLNQIGLLNIEVDYIDSVSKIKTRSEISRLKASFLYMADHIESSANIIMHVEDLTLAEKNSFRDIELELQTSLDFDLSKQSLNFDPSELRINDALLNMEGSIDFSKTALINIKLKGSDKDLSLPNLFLTQSGLKNIRKGYIYFNGEISGSFQKGIPDFNFDFGIKNLTLKIPEVNHSIEDLNFSGSFRSGIRPDFSAATLKIDAINGKLPEGYIIGSFFMHNFVSPYLDYQIDLNTNVSGFEKVFKFSKLDKLQGHIYLNDKYSGKYKSDSGWTSQRTGNFQLLFDSLSFVLPNMNVSLLDGAVDGNLDTSNIRDLILKTEKTDLQVNGKIFNLSQLIVDENKVISADLMVLSDLFDLPQFLSFNPRIGRSFPYKIEDIILNVALSTTRKKLTEHQVTPEINFNIKQLDTTIIGFIPRVTIHRGNFFLGESDTLLHLDFTDFDIEVAGSRLKTNVELFRPPDKSLDLNINLDAQNLNFGKAFFSKEGDTIPRILNAGLDGDMKLYLHFIRIDSISHLRTLNLQSGFLDYTGVSDTLEFEELLLNAQNIHFKKKTNPLTNLSSGIILSIGKVRSSVFNTTDVKFQINAENGSYTVIPEKFSLFGKEGAGKFIVAPFNNPPSYEIKYTVNRFRLEDLLSHFITKQYLSGPADLSVELVFSGKKKKKYCPQ